MKIALWHNPMSHQTKQGYASYN